MGFTSWLLAAIEGLLRFYKKNPNFCLGLSPHRRNRFAQDRPTDISAHAGRKGDETMRRKLTWLILGAVIVGMALYHAGNVLGTPANGFVGTTLAKGRFGAIDVFNHFILSAPQEEPEEHERHKGNIWLSSQRTKGLSDLYVQSNVWQPGGSTGWHSHPGHSLIIVTAGTVTAYEGDDPECKPT